MSGPSTRRDALSNLLENHDIFTGPDNGGEKITIERLELRPCRPIGTQLRFGRVHVLSTVRRRRPISLLPARPPLTLGRAEELENLRQILSDFNTADLYGPDGAGKSHLAATLVHSLDLDHFPDGAVYVTGQIRHQDLLQVLFESFYESDSRVKITARHAPSYLGNLRALVILDDVSLGPKQIDPILDALVNSAVLILGPERTAVGRGQAIHLKGLPREEAIALFEHSLKGTLTPDERQVIGQICAELNDMPLPIVAMATLTAQGKITFNKLLNELQGRKSWAGLGGDLSVGPALEQMVLTLDGTDRQLLTLAAAFTGSSASAEALKSLAELSATEFRAHVEHLERLGLIRVVEPGPGGKALRVALPPAFQRAIRTWLVDDDARRNVVEYYATRLGQQERLEGEELRNLVGAFEDGAHHGSLEALKPLVLAANCSLARLGWWAEWQHVLDLTRRTAQAQGDRAAEAWAMHQLGSLLGAQGAYERAFHMLRAALNMRQALEDEEAWALSAQNLELLDRLMPEPAAETSPDPNVSTLPSREGEQAFAREVEMIDSLPETAPVEKTPKEVERTSAPFGRRVRTAALTFLAILALLAAAGLGYQFLLRDDGSASVDDTSELTVSWEFGDAWNAYDNETWTQQVVIVVQDGKGEYRYFANGEPVEKTFEVVLPLCEGAEGIIRVESNDGQTGQTRYEFASPYCP